MVKLWSWRLLYWLVILPESQTGTGTSLLTNGYDRELKVPRFSSPLGQIPQPQHILMPWGSKRLQAQHGFVWLHRWRKSYTRGKHAFTLHKSTFWQNHLHSLGLMWVYAIKGAFIDLQPLLLTARTCSNTDVTWPGPLSVSLSLWPVIGINKVVLGDE